MKKLLEFILGKEPAQKVRKVSREYVKDKILGCTTPEQMEAAIKYVNLSGYGNDAITLEWIKLKNQMENI